MPAGGIAPRVPAPALQEATPAPGDPGADARADRRLPLLVPGREGEADWRRLSECLMRSFEEERERLSTQLHANVEPIVIAVKFLVEDALHRLADGAVDDAMRLLEEVPQRLRLLVDDLRVTADELRPRLLDERGLLSTLEWQCDAFADKYPSIGVVRRLTAREGDVPPALKLEIHRIAQECLRNVGEHSGASWVRIALFVDTGNLNFLVEDNGTGLAHERMDPDERARIAQGLALMRRRAETTGGRLSFRSVPRHGTQLRIVWKPGSIRAVYR
jgi:signal transduction histidine kinase